MSSKILARRYANALLAVGKEDGQFLQYGEELNEFAGLLKENKQLLDALSNPLYKVKSRKAVLSFLLDRSKYSPMVTNFINLLMEKGRIRFVAGITERYGELTDSIQNIARATLVSAVKLPEDTVDRVKEAVEKITKKTIRLQSEVDPALIGGIVTRVGDLIFDGSVRSQLESLKKSLKRGD